jgi:hypothetical protein
MLNVPDRGKLLQSSEAAGVLVKNLRVLVSADNPLLGEFAIEILQEAVKIDQKIKRIETIAEEGV